jgi:general secretion pathway protein F
MDSGRVEAESSGLALEILLQRQLTPLELSPATPAQNQPRQKLFRPRAQSKLSLIDFAGLVRQLASLLKGGLTVDRAMAIAQRISASPPQQNLIMKLSRDVREGGSLSHGLRQHCPNLPGYCFSLIQAGEASGSLPQLLDRLSQILRRNVETRRKIIDALIYPAILCAMVLVTLGLVVGIVLPRFEQLFAEAGAKLPWSTEAMLAAATMLREYGWVMALVLGTAGLALARWLGTEGGRKRLDESLLNLGPVGAIVRGAESARFASTTGTLLDGGLTVPASLEIASQALNNRQLLGAARKVMQSVREGRSLAAELAAARVFPTVMVELAHVGEQAGNLGEMLQEASRIVEENVDVMLSRLLNLLVPALTLLMGAVIAALFGSVLSGLLSMNDIAM